MSLIVPMIPALLALAGMTVALKAPHPAARGLGAAAAVGVFGAASAVAVAYGYEEIAALFALAAAANVALGVATVREARRARATAERDPYPAADAHRPGLEGRTFTVERVTASTPEPYGGTFAVGRLAVIERRDGVLECLWRVAGVGEDPEEIEQAAAVCAQKVRCHGESARYVRRGLDPDSSASVYHQIAAENTAGGAR